MIFDTSHIVQERMLGSYRRVVKPSRHRMRGGDLSMLVLQHVTLCALQHARATATTLIKTRRMFANITPDATCLDAKHAHRLVIEKRVKHANRIRTATNTRHQDIG